MKPTRMSISTALLAAASVLLLVIGCRQPESVSAPAVHSVAEANDAIAQIQSDQTKSPDEKVKQIAEIQRQYPTHQKHNKDTDMELAPAGGSTAQSTNSGD